jgi:hypothetical protein
VPLLQVIIVDVPDCRELFLQRLKQRVGQHGDPVLVALARAHDNLAVVRIHILHPQPQTFHFPHTGAVKQPRNQSIHAMHASQKPAQFIA